ncbi:hypothetical protein DI392_11465 [Vibrio albus]|uniref:Uncharacterized protein n=1 Tax=Vibrio albus TaxID=2200953 RepID=A0A2U3B9I6_9VIBR|nr:hypothetical protein DI392_11465 [Vibrio albus]
MFIMFTIILVNIIHE